MIYHTEDATWAGGHNFISIFDCSFCWFINVLAYLLCLVVCHMCQWAFCASMKILWVDLPTVMVWLFWRQTSPQIWLQQSGKLVLAWDGEETITLKPLDAKLNSILNIANSSASYIKPLRMNRGKYVSPLDTYSYMIFSISRILTLVELL